MRPGPPTVAFLVVVIFVAVVLGAAVGIALSIAR